MATWTPSVTGAGLLLFLNAGFAQQNANPDNDPPEPRADAASSFADARTLPEGAYLEAEGGALGGTGGDSIDVYRFAVPPGGSFSIDAGVRTAGASLHFTLLDREGSPVVGADGEYAASGPDYTYTRSNAQGGEWGFEVTLAAPDDGSVISYDMTFAMEEYDPGAGSGGGGYGNGGGGSYGGALAMSPLLAILALVIGLRGRIPRRSLRF